MDDIIIALTNMKNEISDWKEINKINLIARWKHPNIPFLRNENFPLTQSFYSKNIYRTGFLLKV
jgi:hypothetical protein